MSQQLPLALRWPAQQRFETFVADGNTTALSLARESATAKQPDWVFLAGAKGSGKSHLLLAACARASANGRRAQYLPLATLTRDRATAIRALGGSELLGIDDVDTIAGERDSEHALFDLYNRGKADKATLLFAAVRPPAQLGLSLPDLVSRLSACAQAQLKPLDEAARRAALRQRAAARGLELDDAVIDWLFAHTPRDLGSLTALIERVDRESLAAKRRITIPFLRGLLTPDEAR